MGEERGRNNSMARLGYSTLRQLNALKQTKIISSSLSRLRDFKTTYDRPFLQAREPTEKAAENEEEEEAVLNLSLLFEPDFARRSLKLCEDIIFHVGTFTKIFKESHRTKIIFTKLHGWDDYFQEIFFPHKRAELRMDLSATEMQHKLGFTFRTLKVRNVYNKLRLFLGELISFNKRQQELEGRFMKTRISNQLSKLDKEVLSVLSSKQCGDRLKYVQDITRTHEVMLNAKMRVRNKVNNIMEIEQNLGRVNINEFYIKEEGNIDEIEKYFTRNRLKRDY